MQCRGNARLGFLLPHKHILVGAWIRKLQPSGPCSTSCVRCSSLCLPRKGERAPAYLSPVFWHTRCHQFSECIRPIDLAIHICSNTLSHPFSMGATNVNYGTHGTEHLAQHNMPLNRNNRLKYSFFATKLGKFASQRAPSSKLFREHVSYLFSLPGMSGSWLVSTWSGGFTSAVSLSLGCRSSDDDTAVCGAPG